MSEKNGLHMSLHLNYAVKIGILMLAKSGNANDDSK